MIFEPLVANVADVALNLAQEGGIFFRHDVVPSAAIEIVNDVVQLQLLQRQSGRPVRLADILVGKIYDRALVLFYQIRLANSLILISSSDKWSYQRIGMLIRQRMT